MAASQYSLTSSTWDEKEQEAMQRVIASGFYSMGEEVREFEKAFAAFTGSKHCVMVNSGSSANLLMIAALRYHSKTPLMPGDEVIVPAVSWSTTYSPLYQYGLKLKFVDVDINSLNMDAELVRQAIGPKTKAILAVSLLGNPADFNTLAKIARDNDLLLLEDNCESLGATIDGQQTGTFGMAGSYSSFFSHHISTMEGGMVVCEDEELYHIMLSIRAHGWTRNLPEENLVSGTKSKNPFEESFNFVLPGYNLRPLEFSGAIGREQVKKLPTIVSERRKNGVKFMETLSRFENISIQKENGESSWFGFSMLIGENAGFTRAELVEQFQSHNIDCRPIVAGDFTQNPVMKYFDYEIFGELPNAQFVHHNGLFVGNHHFSLEKEIDLLGSVLDKMT